MRQGQQNRRGRGRNNNNNRKSQNPLTRSFESTGPDVKLRGTPSHIAEKYMSLARDAHSSGDHVLAENYMQHAEHYNRIIMTVREQQMSQGGADPFQNGMARPARAMVGPQDPLADGDEFGDDEGDDFSAEAQTGQQAGEAGPQPPQMQQPPRQFEQPRFESNNRHQHNQHRNDFNRHGQHQQHRHDRGENRYDRNDRHDRGDRHNRFDRQDRFERGPQPERAEGGNDWVDRNAGGNANANGNGNSEPRPPRDERQPQVSHDAGAPEQNRRPRFQNGPRQPMQAASDAPGQAHQPDFLRRPVRRPRREDEASEAPRTPAGEDNKE